MPAKKPAARRATTKTPRATAKSSAQTKRVTPSRRKAAAPKKARRGSAAKSNRRLPAMLLAGVGVALALALFSNNNSGSVTPSPSGKPLVENGGLWQSAVQIAWQTKKPDGSFSSYCGGGSGGLVGEPDQVLTNEHVIDDSDNDGDCADAALYVGYPVESTGVWFVWWPASVRGESAFFDLAIVEVDLTANAVVENTDYPASIVLENQWPVYTVASNVPNLGDPISIYSYPEIGWYSMTYTAGHVAGWSWDRWDDESAKGQSEAWMAEFRQDADGRRDYMKLDATVAHGSSGSSVLNQNGEIIGVSTLVGVGFQTDAVDCIQFVDTNEDGNIDDKDACVPVGGFLNAAATLTDIRAFLTKQGLTP